MNDRLDDLEAGKVPMEVPRQPTKARTKAALSKKSKIRVVKKIFLSKKNAIKETKAVETCSKDDERALVMELFYKNVEDLQLNIKAIQDATNAINCMTDDLATSMTSEREKQIDSKACSTVNETNMIAQGVRSKLRLLQDETKELKSQNNSLVESDFRIREGLVSAITRKFIDELRLYQTAQQSFKVLLTNNFKRQVQAINPTLTDQDMETLIQSGEDKDDLVQEMILASPGRVHQRIQKVRSAVTEKQQAVYQLEQSVAVVHRMFLDLALLTEEQGILLDQIEHHVKQSGDYIEEGNETLYESYQISKKIRKKKFIVILIAGVVTLIIVLAL